MRRLHDLGFSHVYAGLGEDPPQEISKHHFDVVVAGEIIEHVRNAGRFLDATARLVAPEGVMVITTPNALRFSNRAPALLGADLIHPEHLSWYSPHTLRKILAAGPYTVDRLRIYDSAHLAGLEGVGNPLIRGACVEDNASVSLLHAILVRMFPYLSDGSILVGRPAGGG